MVEAERYPRQERQLRKRFEWELRDLTAPSPVSVFHLFVCFFG